MEPDKLKELLEQFATGGIDVVEVVRRLTDCQPVQTAATIDARVDLGRKARCGFPEVVYCEGKTNASIVEIFKTLENQNQSFLGTRISDEQANFVLQHFPQAIYNNVGRTIRSIPQNSSVDLGPVSVITAGTSDRPVAEEAVETLRWMGCSVDLIVDVGVAGPHRLSEQLHRFADSDAIIVVAGMEGALPSVVGGWVDCPVIAVPTSVGYGASFGGIAALLGMLNSCASNVTVVNIDAGFKAGYVAGLISKKIHQKAGDC